MMFVKNDFDRRNGWLRLITRSFYIHSEILFHSDG
jgi:hypothetical protein